MKKIISKNAVLFIQNKPLKIINLNIPKLIKGQVLIKMKYTSICRSQIMEIEGKRGKDKWLPHLLGHEGSGIVIEVGEKVKYFGIDKKFYYGQYLFTIDWAHPDPNILDVEHSEVPDEHKCAHILALTNGNYAAQPNNRILWDAPNYTVGDGVPDYSVQTTKWNVENKDWLTEDSNKMFYEIDKND